MTTIGIIAFIILLIGALTYSVGSGGGAAYGQQVFESPEKGIRLQVPAGYQIEAKDTLSPESLSESSIPGLDVQSLLDSSGIKIPEFMAAVCPQELAKPAIGGTFTCEDPPDVLYGPRQGSGIIGEADSIHVMRFNNLIEKPEFEAVARQNKNITVDDLVIYNEMAMTSFSPRIEFQILKTTNTTVNYYPPPQANSGAMEPIALPAKIIDAEYTINWRDPNSFPTSGSMTYRALILHALGPDGNTGYILAYEQPAAEAVEAIRNNTAANTGLTWIPPEVGSVFDSFELIAATR